MAFVRAMMRGGEGARIRMGIRPLKNMHISTAGASRTPTTPMLMRPTVADARRGGGQAGGSKGEGEG